ncbi:hypothetical protein DN752_10320 [Echinicola strongylocentroti]|uniref:Uncharacterized protein n=1 Tax=Echinicola strongylocentroti TaxID=1795355 RepID=A0A2Z4IIE5_9BACT|nr:hypothetical protein DN752_10320 [Echinicola strongylocentroti]
MADNTNFQHYPPIFPNILLLRIYFKGNAIIKPTLIQLSLGILLIKLIFIALASHKIAFWLLFF